MISVGHWALGGALGSCLSGHEMGRGWHCGTWPRPLSRSAHGAQEDKETLTLALVVDWVLIVSLVCCDLDRCEIT